MQRMTTIGAGALVSAALLAGAPAARGQDLEAQNQALRADIQRLAQELQEINRRLDANEQAIASSNASEVEVSTQGGIKLESADGAFTAALGGRVQVDSAFYEEDKSRLGDGTQLRRLYVTLSGTLHKDWAYKSEVDFANNGTSIRDAYIAYKGFEALEITLGHFKEPFSLEEITSDKYITFMERALPSAFVPSRHLGVMASASGERWSLAAGGFRGDADDDPAGEGDERWSLTARATAAPVLEEDALLHLGFGAHYRDPNSEGTTFSAKPESNITGARFVTTGALAKLDDLYVLGPELAAVYGPLSLQGEYMMTHVNRSSGRDDLDFQGWYVYGSYFLTGESRAAFYKAGGGAFGRVKPNANLGAEGIGAVELAARFSTLDLTDGSVRGGSERNITLGLNWYVNPSIRFTANYVRVDNDNKALGNAANLEPGESFAGDDDPDIFQVRAQLVF